MQAAVAFVAENPGVLAARVTAHLLETSPKAAELRTLALPGIPARDMLKTSAYKQAASVVDRIIRDRLVRQDVSLRLHPWDANAPYAEALERAALVAPDPVRFSSTMSLAIAAWREAGDENRARILERLVLERSKSGKKT